VGGGGGGKSVIRGRDNKNDGKSKSIRHKSKKRMREEWGKVNVPSTSFKRNIIIVIAIITINYYSLINA
jgi:hypothetical protein